METLSTQQASEILGVSRRRVIALIEQGKLRATKFASVYSIERKDLDAVRVRRRGRPAKDHTVGSDRPFLTIFDVAPELVGAGRASLPSDLSTGKRHMEAYGEASTKKR